MAKPVNEIGQNELNPTLKILTSAGWTTDDFGLLRKGTDGAIAKEVLTFLRGLHNEAPAVQPVLPVLPPVSDYRGPYWDERAQGPYWTYPSGWVELADAPVVLAYNPEHFPKLDFSHVEPLIARYRTGENGLITLPQGMTALALCPKLTSAVISKLGIKSKKSWQPVNLLMQYLLGVLKEVYGDDFHDYMEGKIGPEYHRLAETTARALAIDAARTPGDVHVLPVQTGTRFAGYSVRAVRGHLSALSNEVGMHCVLGTTIMLWNPGRYVNGSLYTDWPGTERSPRADDKFDDAPYGGRGARKLGLRSRWVNDPDQNAGSGSFVVLPE